MIFLQDIFNSMLPEIIILLTIFTVIIISMFYNVRFYKLSKWIALGGIVLALFSLQKLQLEPIYYAFNYNILSDTFTVFFKALILVAAIMIILLSKKNVSTRNHKTFQFYALLLSAIFSSLLILSSNDFITLTITLEMLSFSLYFLIAYKKGYLSKEASFKYLITNAFATSIYLFGVSYLYGLTSSFNFNDINNYFMKQDASFIYTFANIFIITGLLFKLAILPFANWVLEVYEGAHVSVTAFISTIPKIAMIALIARLLVFPAGYSFELPFVLIILSAITAIWANILAIRQKNILKILACSSSANVSYMLFVLALVSVSNLATVLFYLITYVFMNLGAFANIVALENSGYSKKLSDLKGLVYTNPMFTLAFTICILGLAGFPITSGFVAKLYLLSAIVTSGILFVPFLLLIIFAIVIGAYYYTNIIKVMFEKSKDDKRIIYSSTTSQSVVLYLCAIITLIVGICPSKLVDLCKFIAYNL